MTDTATIQQVIQQANKKVDAILVLETQAAEKRVAGKAYTNRERIPEPLLVYADLYHELTKQEPTPRALSDWVLTFEEWKMEKLQPEHIRAAMMQALGEKGFSVGRPGALTITAIAAKSKAVAAPVLEVNRDAIEATRRAADEKWNDAPKVISAELVQRDRPKNLLPPKPKRPLFKKGMEPR